MIDYIPYKEHKRELRISSLSDRLRENRVDNWQDYEDAEQEETVPVFDEDIYSWEI
jgi:hypothetical protein